MTRMPASGSVVWFKSASRQFSMRDAPLNVGMMIDIDIVWVGPLKSWKIFEIVQPLTHDRRDCIRQKVSRMKCRNRNCDQCFFASHTGKLKILCAPCPCNLGLLEPTRPEEQLLCSEPHNSKAARSRVFVSRFHAVPEAYAKVFGPSKFEGRSRLFRRHRG